MKTKRNQWMHLVAVGLFAVALAVVSTAQTTVETTSDRSTGSGGGSTVASASALFSLEAQDGDVVTTKGYTTIGAGSNTYYYDADDDSSTIDGGFVLPGTGGTLSFDASYDFDGTEGTGRWIAVDQTVADVRKFGAYGDGVSDDVGPVQRAIDSGAPVVYFPSGDYKIGDDSTYLTHLVIRSNLEMLGDGHQKSRIISGKALTAYSDTVDKTRQTFIRTPNYRAYTTTSANLVRNVQFRNLGFVGLRDASGLTGFQASYEYYACIALESIQDVLIDNCEIKDFHGSGVYVGGSSVTGVDITAITTGATTTITVPGHTFSQDDSVTVMWCDGLDAMNGRTFTVSSVSGDDIVVPFDSQQVPAYTGNGRVFDAEYDWNRNVTVTNCNLVNCLRGGVTFTGLIGGEISGNSLWGHGFGVHIENGTADYFQALSNIVVSDNLMRGFTDDGTTPVWCASAYDRGYHSISYQNNMIFDCRSTRDAFINPIGTGTRWVNNTIKNCSTSGFPFFKMFGKSMVCSGNIFDKCSSGQYFITLATFSGSTGEDYLLVSANQFIDCNGPSSGSTSNRFLTTQATTPGTVIITDNFIRTGGFYYGFYIDESDCLIKDNFIHAANVVGGNANAGARGIFNLSNSSNSVLTGNTLRGWPVAIYREDEKQTVHYGNDTDGSSVRQSATRFQGDVGFYGTLPITQPSVIADATNGTDVIDRCNDIIAALESLGLIAQ